MNLFLTPLSNYNSLITLFKSRSKAGEGRAGVTELIIPDETRQALTFIFIKEIDQALAEALQNKSL